MRQPFCSVLQSLVTTEPAAAMKYTQEMKLSITDDRQADGQRSGKRQARLVVRHAHMHARTHAHTHTLLTAELLHL